MTRAVPGTRVDVAAAARGVAVQAQPTAADAVARPTPDPAPAQRAHDVVVPGLLLAGARYDAVTYEFWTFGGGVPGPMIRVREGDYVTINLQNHPDSRFPHNIDLHAVQGQGGGAETTLITPGQRAGFGFAALAPGLYVDHCATAPVGMHVANGMHGLIVVDPAGGSTVAEMTFTVPATYILVDHSIFRAFNEGALGTIVVTGPEEPDVLHAYHDVRPYAPAER